MRLPPSVEFSTTMTTNFCSLIFLGAYSLSCAIETEERQAMCHQTFPQFAQSAQPVMAKVEEAFEEAYHSSNCILSQRLSSTAGSGSNPILKSSLPTSSSLQGKLYIFQCGSHCCARAHWHFDSGSARSQTYAPCRSFPQISKT